MILDPNNDCPQGKEINTADRCREADDWATTLNIHPVRSPVAGTWQGVPFQCSIQVAGDNAIHFNEKTDTDNSRLISGEFVRICEKGIICLLYLYTCFFYFATICMISLTIFLSFHNRKLRNCGRCSCKELEFDGTKFND